VSREARGRTDLHCLPAMPEAVASAVTDYLTRSGTAGRVVPLTGDASDRRYYRILRDDGRSVVLAVSSAPFDFASLPFANVTRLLSAMPVPVPKILGHAGDLGVLELEDLGDVTLQAHLGVAEASKHDALYRQAVSYIEVMQRRGAELAGDEYLPYTIAFDVQKLTWELDFFAKHFLVAYRGAVLSEGDRAALSREWATIVDELASEPRVLCHRDYHSRNLMWHDGRLMIIDYQDARMGPDTYDLVSLLRDSYVDLPDAAVDNLISYFLALKGRAADAAGFRTRFDVMSLQRNLKALGTFGFQTTSRGNTVYIQYIPRTLRLAADNLRKHARFARLREILAPHLPELA
jgi:aminoglycoside/choline kinase family phosphotransferase